MILASQLPEATHDAKMVLQAIRELLDTFMIDDEPKAVERPVNVLTFPAG